MFHSLKHTSTASTSGILIFISDLFYIYICVLQNIWVCEVETRVIAIIEIKGQSPNGTSHSRIVEHYNFKLEFRMIESIIFTH